MRPTETSGAGIKGFSVAGFFQARSVHGTGAGLASNLNRRSPIAVATVLATLVLTLGLICWDVLNTLHDATERSALAAQFDKMQPLVSDRALALEFAQAMMQPNPADAWTGVALRGLAALALALGLCGFALRWRGEHVQSRRELRRYQDLIATIPFGVACWTATGRLIICNEQYMARLNASSRDFRPGASYNGSIARLAQGGYMQLLNEDENNRLLELHREDGSCLLIDERPLGEGGFVTLVTDVTESRRTNHLLSSIREEQRVLARRYHEEKLRAEAASRSKTSFLAHLSHDIRTPLNHIIGFAELMRHQTYGPLGDKRYLSYVETIQGSGERLLSFFASILDLAELESGRKELRPEVVAIDDVVLSIERRYKGQAQRAGLAFAAQGGCEAKLLCDRFSVERMMGNLVDNAIRFTPSGGKVVLAVYVAADGVVLEVTDTGIGMPVERLAALSQPFSFGDAALTKAHQGAGLGLSIARAIAELNGGRLAIDSTLGVGTTVAVSLPLLAAEAQQHLAA